MKIKKIYDVNGNEVEIGYENGRYMWFHNMNYFFIEELYISGFTRTKQVSNEIRNYNKYPIFRFETDGVYIELGNKIFKEFEKDNEFRFCQVK